MQRFFRQRRNRRARPTGLLRRWLGRRARADGFMLADLPVPMPRLELPEVAPLEVRMPPLPTVDLPAVPLEPWGTPGSRAAWRWPTLPSSRCPIDIMSLLTDVTPLDLRIGPDAGSQ